MGRELKFTLNDTTLTSNLNQELSNLLTQTNKVKAKVVVVEKTANTALSTANAPVLRLEDLSDVVITLPITGQTLTYKNGTGWVNGSGGITGLDGFFGAGLATMLLFQGGTTPSSISTTNNQVTAFLFTLNETFVISRISCNVTTSAALSAVNFGIYDSSGNKLIDSGAIVTTSTGIKSVTITPVTLLPGSYYFAQSSDHSAVQVTGWANQSVALTNLINAHGVIKIGQAANATSGNVLPSTLGVIAADSLFINMDGAYFSL